MSIRTAFAFILALGLVAAPASAVTLDYLGYTSLNVLGDSTSDNGNVYRRPSGDEPRSPPYWRGRFSNGPVWSDHLARRFKAAGVPTSNLALGGARAEGGATDIGNQASLYRLIDRDRRGSRPLLTLWAGGNDIKRETSEPGIRAVGRGAADAVGDAIASLSRTGAEDFLVFNLPDMGKIPFFLRRGGDRAFAATRGALAFNRELDRQIAELRARGLNIHLVNTYALFEAMVADPLSFGLRDVRTPCFRDGILCTERQARDRAFFDEVHANFVVHEHLAEAALALLDPSTTPAVLAVPFRGTAGSPPGPAPVPLPAPAALLLAGLVVLGCARLRRRPRVPDAAH
jgi:outer membrane lipase/esterase